MKSTVIEVLEQALGSSLDAAVQLFPRVLAMMVLVVGGGLAAFVLGRVVGRVLRLMKFNALCRKSGFTELLEKAEMPAPDVLAGRLAFWVVWTVFILSGLSALGLQPAGDLMSEVFLFIPRLLSAILILAVGILLASFVSRAALLAAVNADLPSAPLLGNLVRFFIVIMAVTMALDQLSLARAVVLTAFAIAFGSIMLALALAFGMGGRDAARRLLEKRFSETRPAETDELSHL